MFTKQQQYIAVLEVLNLMKACIDANSTYVCIDGKSFNLHKPFGICWHVFAHTPATEISGIDPEYLEQAFLDMGLKATLPVESQLQYESADQWNLYNDTRYDRYDASTEVGQTRIKLLNELIQYFENVLTTESEPV